MAPSVHGWYFGEVVFAMGVHQHLTNEERIVLQRPPFYLTTHRLLRCEDVVDRESFREIPLRGITEVEKLRETDHKMMSVGSVLVVSSVILIATWGLLTAFLGVVAGVVMAGCYAGYGRLHRETGASVFQFFWRSATDRRHGYVQECNLEMSGELGNE